MKKSKRKLIIRIILFSFSMFLLIVGISGLNTYHNKLEAVSYLTSKYGTIESEYELVKHYPQKLINNSSNTSNMFEFYLTNEKWKFKYNDKLFYVEKINNKFYDNCQLEEISYWAQKYLKASIDNNIIGVEIDSKLIYDPTLPNLPTNTNELINNDTALQLLFENREGYRKTLNIYYLVDNQNAFRNSLGRGNEKYEELKESIEIKLDAKNKNIDINLLLFENSMSFVRYDTKIKNGFSDELYGIPHDLIEKEKAYF